ncbi:MAG: hypothetical protein ACFFAJ_13040 [Candidatus Hodarchaeota archaeon]
MVKPNQFFPNKLFFFLEYLYNDKLLVFAIIIATVITIGNITNKILLNFEPLQYSLFSYDKIPHLLAAFILVRCIYWFLIFNNPDSPQNLILRASVITIILYAVIWESFELFTFLIQESISDQFLSELFDVPLDWLYDLAGVFLSYFLGISSPKK